MRRHRADKRTILPDPRYKDLLVSKFINIVMNCGKKSTAERIVYGALDIVAKRVNSQEPAELIRKAMHNARPLLQLKSRRVGGATYQIPVEVDEDKGIGIAMRWIRDGARSRKGRNMQDRLADELADAFNGTGSAMKKREEIHKMAEANRAFSHYRW